MNKTPEKITEGRQMAQEATKWLDDIDKAITETQRIHAGIIFSEMIQQGIKRSEMLRQAS